MAKKNSFSRKVLVAAAEDMTAVMGLEPPIDTSKGVKDKALEASIRDNASEVAPNDKLTDATWKLLADMGVGPKRESRSKKDKGKKKKEDTTPPPDKKKDDSKKGNGRKKKAAGGVHPSKKSLPKTKDGQIFSRTSALWDALSKKWQTMEELAERCNDIYINSGGKDNMKQSLHVAKLATHNFYRYPGLVEFDEEGRVRKTS